MVVAVAANGPVKKLGDDGLFVVVALDSQKPVVGVLPAVDAVVVVDPVLEG